MMKKITVLISVMLTLIILSTTITQSTAAEILPTYNTNQSQDFIYALVMEEAKLYKENSDSSTVLFILQGGELLKADKNSLNDEMIPVLYDDTLCFIHADQIKTIVGTDDFIIEISVKMHERYAWPGESAIEITKAPEYYTVNGALLPLNYQDYLWSVALHHGIESYYKYLLAQFYLESRFNQASHSYTNDYGICQLNGKYHEGFKERAGHPEWDLISDPFANMYCGVQIMARNIERRGGDLDLAWTDYNAGAGYTMKHGAREVYCNGVRSWYNKIQTFQ